MDLIDDFMCSHTFIQVIYLLDPEKTNVSCNMCKELPVQFKQLQSSLLIHCMWEYILCLQIYGLSFVSILVETSPIIIANTEYQTSNTTTISNQLLL